VVVVGDDSGGELMYAPGTESGGQSGIVIEGGEMKFAPGTSEGGPSGVDIKTVEVKTGGGSDSGGTTVEGNNQNAAPPVNSSENSSGGKEVEVIKE